MKRNSTNNPLPKCVCGHKEFIVSDNQASRLLKPTITCTKCGESWCSGYDAKPYSDSKFAHDQRTILLTYGGKVVKDLKESLAQR